jgi:Domain of unknown function (DUF5134)
VVIAPAWLTDSLAVAMLAVAAYCASRLAIARLTHRATHYSVDAVHTAMGVAMAGMLTSRLTHTAPWVVVFAAAAGWFGLRATGGLLGGRTPSVAVGPHLRHLVTSGAMVYMLTAMPAAAAASTPAATTMAPVGVAGSARFPTLALLLGTFLIGSTVIVMDRLSRRSARPATAREGTPGIAGSDRTDAASILAPRTLACCQIAMNITMGYMLVTLL